MPAVRRNKLIETFWVIHRWLYKGTGGRIGSKLEGMGVLLLTTTGRKTGKPRTTPLMYIEDDGRYVVIASNAGEPRHPGWLFNIRANPICNAQVKSNNFQVQGWEASDDDYERLWNRVVETNKSYLEYQLRTERRIPIVLLKSV